MSTREFGEVQADSPMTKLCHIARPIEFELTSNAIEIFISEGGVRDSVDISNHVSDLISTLVG